MNFNIRKKMHKFLTSKSVDIVYALILIIIFYVMDTIILKRGFNFSDYFELKLATSLSATYFIAVFFRWITKRIEKNIEDGLKLTTDYDSVIDQYHQNRNKMVCHKKNDLSSIFTYDKAKKIDEKRFKLEYERYPIIMEYSNNTSTTLEIVDDPNKQYVLPSIVESNFIDIFDAHKHSQVFNAVNVRLDDIVIDDNKVKFKTSRTSYFNGLVTNRAMDHSIAPMVSLRKLFEYESKISPLINSKMSNHLGINGSVIGTDNKIVFIKRFSNVSIGKNILGCSLGASLKTKHCLDPESGVFTLDGLEKGIRAELYDELGLESEHYEFSFEKSIVGVYRDLVEGGKPQVLIAVRATVDSDTLVNLFNKKKLDKSNKKKLLVDGNKIVCMDIDSIQTNINTIVNESNKTKYATIPSVAASTVLAIDWFKKHS